MAMIVTGLVVTAAPAQAAGSTSGTVSGIVFQDFTSAGWYTTGSAGAGVPRNRPIAGITATAYDAQGDAVGTAVSGADGTYSLDVTGAYSADLRVEFSGWPDQYKPAFAAQGTPPPSTAGSNDTSAQFVTLTGGTATGVDFGLIIPDQVVQNDAPIASAIMYAGAPDRTQTGPYAPQNLSSIVAQPWSATGSSDDPGHFGKRTELANFAEVGSVYGLTYNRTKNFMVASATIKRMSGIGPLGLGGIYAAPNTLNADGTVRAGAVMEPWFRLDDPSGLNIDVGAIASNADRGIGMPAIPAHDIPGFEGSARAGIGGIATSLDGNTLFVTNLHDKKVYAIDISGGDAVTPTQYRVVDTPVGANQQLWAIMVYSGRLYIGFVDTGTAPGVAASAAGMRAYVRSVPVEAAIAGTPGTWREELTMSLGYTKGSNLTGWGNGSINQSNTPQLYRWNSWADTWSWTGGSVGFKSTWGGGSPNPNNCGSAANPTCNTHAYPQPILAGLAIDIDGYLNLGFLDRTDLQSGQMNYPAISGVTNQFYESVTGGDTLAASPAGISDQNQTGVCASTGEYRVECNGKVGDRAVRTTTVAGQGPTYNNNEGPATGEFFNDLQNRGRGSGGDIHRENTLGSVLTYPGIDEVAVTAIDPGPGVYRSGTMWFDQRDGTATRYFDQVTGVKDIANPAFEKGGGLGAIALLAVAAPVEIGNRVWLDADLNGRQDADEPAINGAIVELWTDDDGEPGVLVGTRSTSTINGQPGTFYFRTDDADLMVDAANPGDPAFVPEESYVLVYRPGTGAVDLQGANAGHAGFAGLTWSDLQLTTPDVRVTGKTTEVNDSNAQPVTGYGDWTPVEVGTGAQTGTFGFDLGGPGENNHTYDAGYYGTNTYQLEKIVDLPEGVELPAGTTFTIDVESAANFRGEDRLAASGGVVPGTPGIPGDPQVSEVTFTIEPGQTITTTQQLPFGYALTFAESGDTTGATVTFAPANGGNAAEGRLVVTPAGGQQLRAKLDVTNAYGGFTLQKLLPQGTELPAGTTFSLTYAIGDGDPQTVPLTAGADPVRPVTDPIPYGTTITVCELTPTVPGWTWEGVTWTVNESALTPGPDGCVSGTITAQASDLAFAATNDFDQVFGTFTVDKSMNPAGTATIPGDTEFTAEYKVGSLEATTQTLTVTPDGAAVGPGAQYPYGTVVYLREVLPAPPAGVAWGTPAWTGAGGTATDGEGVVWQTLTVTGNPVTAALGLQNTAEQLRGTFTVDKSVNGSGSVLVPGDTPFYVDYRVGSMDATLQTMGPVTPAGVAVGPGTDFPYGTVIYVHEQEPLPAVPGVTWGTPAWTGGTPVDGHPGWVSITITDSEQGVQLGLANTADIVKGAFSVTKDVTGTGEHLVADQDFTIEYAIGDATPATETIAAGESFTVSDLPYGTVVKLREITADNPEIPGVGWGTPVWKQGDTVLTPGDDGYVTFTITGDPSTLALVVENPATEIFGGFLVSKSLQGSGSGLVPTSFQIEYEIDGVADSGTVTTLQSLAVTDVSIGSVVRVREVPPAAVPGVEWTPAAWTVDGVAIDPDANGWIQFTVTQVDAAYELVVTNVATQLFGSFDVTKSVVGTGASLVPDTAEFLLEYRLDGGATQSLTVTPAAASAAVDNLPFGTVVQIREVGFPVIDGIEDWGDPVWRIGTDTLTPDANGWVSFTIDSTERVAFALENDAQLTYGQFQVDKSVTGTGAGIVPGDTVFQLQYRLGDGDPVALTVTPDTASTLVSGIPYGTVVAVRELLDPPPAVPGVEFGTPTWSIGETVLVPDANGWVSFTVDSSELVTFSLENVATEIFGTFQVTKVVAGAGADRVPDGQQFVIEYSIDGGETWTQLDPITKGDPVVLGPDVRVGTTVLMREVAPEGGPSWEWGTPVFSGEGVNPGEGTAEFVITERDQTVGITLTNEALPLDGAFSVLKRVTGPGAGGLESGFEFVVTYTYDGLESSQTIVVRNGETGLSELIPAGTEVTITEVRPTGGLDDGYLWGGPVWTLPDGTTVSGSVTITIGAEQTLALTLENPTVPPLPVTGGTVGWTVGLLGAGLLLCGLAMMILRRRRLTAE